MSVIMQKWQKEISVLIMAGWWRFACWEEFSRSSKKAGATEDWDPMWLEVEDKLPNVCTSRWAQKLFRHNNQHET